MMEPNQDDLVEFEELQKVPHIRAKAREYFLKEFIISFKRLPILWDSSHIHYRHKLKKLKALQKLTLVYRKIKPNATIEDTRKKINSLRSNYRKELRKVEISKALSTDADDMYQPKAVVYHLLTFLNNSEESKSANSSMELVEEDEEEYSIPDHDNSDVESPTSPTIFVYSTPAPKKKQTSKQKSSNFMAHSSNSINSTDLNPMALYWSEKLKNLDQTQRFFAEKAINDILFEAELGLLHRYSVIINVTQDSLKV